MLAKATVAVVRHAERVDGAWDPAWIGTHQWEQYPHDPPITEVGRQQAVTCSERILATGASFDVIVSSPYLRCVQTALVLAEALDASIMLDYELGEFMGKEVFGDEGPSSTPWRSRQELRSALEVLTKFSSCLSRLKLDRVLGVPPQWPESRSEASTRYACRFVTYLKRASRSRQHVVLVTHGPMFPACARVLPASSGLQLASVGYCAALIARLWQPKTGPSMSRTARGVKSYSMLDDIDDDLQAADLQSESSRWWEVLLQGVEHEYNSNDPLSLRRMTQLQAQLDFSAPEMHKVLGSQPPAQTACSQKVADLQQCEQETHFGRQRSCESADSYQTFWSPGTENPTSPFSAKWEIGQRPTPTRSNTCSVKQARGEGVMLANLQSAVLSLQRESKSSSLETLTLSLGAKPRFMMRRRGETSNSETSLVS